MQKPIKVTVKRISAGGLVVSLPHDKEGFIRERELGQDRKGRKRALSSFKPGEQVEAIIIGKTHKERSELSVSLADYAQWVAANKYGFGVAVLDGEVTGVMPYGAFVELAPGVTGLLHISELPDWSHKDIAELFWPGDSVKVVVETANRPERKLHLSMPQLSRWQTTQKDQTHTHMAASEQNDSDTSARLFDSLLSRPPLSILVVEDDPWQQRSLVNWLQKVGQVVEAVESFEAAIERIPDLRPDLILTDLSLPGMNGIDGIQRFLNRQNLRFAVMTDWGSVEQHTETLQTLRESGVSLLLKPLLPVDLLEVLLQSDQNRETTDNSVSPLRLITQRSPSNQKEEDDDDLHKVLMRLLNNSQADKVVLFEMEVDSRRIQIVEEKGRPRLNGDALPELVHSPVRDVIEEKKRVIARDLHDTGHKRFLHLRPLLNFEACIGEPIQARLHNQYALFLFFAHPINLTERLQARIESSAAIVGLWLERQHLIKQSADLHRTALLGQLNRTMVHEISGRLSPLNLILEELQDKCAKAQTSAECNLPEVVAVIADAHKTLQTLSAQTQSLVKTVRSFSRMTRTGQEEIVVLSEVVEDAITMLEDSARAARVHIVTHPAPRFFFTRAQVTSLQQILVNVLQNAIQQIHLLRPNQGGQVAVALTQHTHEEEQILRVTIEDDGPGIHRRLWERIFEMDYTTRTDGSGLGLYISRRLIESQGGRIYVQNSQILWGTVIAIELPYRM